MRRAFLLLLALFASLPAFGLWRTLKTDAFTVFYPKGHEAEAEQILRVLENYRGYVGSLVGGRPRRVAIVLEDAGTLANGLTDVIYHRILLFRSSPTEGELGYHRNWWRLVGVHEYTHWRHLSSAAGLPGLLTAVFGNNLAPGEYTPSWLKEGICVVAESGISPYEGRLNEGLFDAYATVLAKTGGLPTIVQATYNMDVFPGGTGPYLLGGQFLQFLHRKYGTRKLASFFMHYSSSILSYLSPALPAAGLDRSARKVLGEPIRELWIEWQKQLMKQSVAFDAPGRALTDHGWWLRSPVASRGSVYYQHSFPVKPALFSQTWLHLLLRLDPTSGRSRVLLRSSAPFTGPMRVRADKLYYGLQELEGGHANHWYNRFGFTSVLFERDLESGRTRRLFEEPFRTFEVLSDGTILTAADRPDAFGSVIRLHDPAGGPAEQLLVTDLLVSDIVADSRHLFFAAREDWDSTGIYRVDVSGWSGAGRALAGLSEPIRLERVHETPCQESELCLTERGLFYSATCARERTLYRYEPESGAVFRSVESDFARSPAWDEEGRNLYYIGLNPGGEALYREKPLELEVEQPPEGAEAPAGAPPALPPEAIRRGGYWDNLASLLPRMFFPVLALDFGLREYQAGAGIAGMSALGDFHYVLLAYYDSVDGRPEMAATLDSSLLAPLSAGLYFSSAELYELGLTLEWPLYRSLRKGLSYLSIGASGLLEWSEQEETRILLPFTTAGFQGAASSFFFQVGVHFEEDVDEGIFGYNLAPAMRASMVFLGAELSVQARGLYDLGDAFWDLPEVRGYEGSPLSGRWGGFLESSLSVPLLRIRGGLWNPGLYFGDLFFAPFTSLSANQDRELQLSYGAAFHLELKAGAWNQGLPLEMYAGLGITLEGELFPILELRIHGYSSTYGAGSAAQPRAALGR
jgi:hypothetical protein